MPIKEDGREYYEHDVTCTKDSFNPANISGLKQCTQCAGIFDHNGNGVALQDKRFDEPRD